MAQLSRPFQIALLAAGLLAAAWFFALRGHPASTGSSNAPAPTSSAPSAAAQAQKAAAPTPIYHGPAPGVEGLTRAIARAHAAVAASQQNAKQLAEKSAQASSASAAPSGSSEASSQTGSATPSTASGASRPTATGHRASTRPTATSSSPATHAAASSATGKSSAGASVPARQAAVERELKRGYVVAVLFWNPKGSDDVAVHNQLQQLLAVHRRFGSVKGVPALRSLLKALGVELNSKFAVQEASASQVTSFGSITRGVQVYQTPTILLINPHGKTSTLTGLTDTFSIEQAIDEVHTAAEA